MKRSGILIYMWKEIGKKLREARDKKEQTQEEVAKASAITTSYYARIERGEENPSLDVLRKIAAALKIKSSEILPF